MNTNIKGSGISLTPSITEYVDKRLKKVTKVLGNDTALQCDVELAKTTAHHQKGEIFMAEIHIVGSGKDIFARSQQEDLYSAIDIVTDEVLSEVKSKKAKQISFVRRGGARMKSMM